MTVTGIVEHWTGGPAEHVWRCPRCDLKVRTSRRPGACPDHPFDLMEQETR